jgi:hypothetical protein
MDLRRVGVGRDGGFAQFSFSARQLLRKDVACECVAPFHFAGRRYFEALGSAFMGF